MRRHFHLLQQLQPGRSSIPSTQHQLHAATCSCPWQCSLAGTAAPAQLQCFLLPGDSSDTLSLCWQEPGPPGLCRDPPTSKVPNLGGRIQPDLRQRQRVQLHQPGEVLEREAPLHTQPERMETGRGGPLKTRHQLHFISRCAFLWKLYQRVRASSLLRTGLLLLWLLPPLSTAGHCSHGHGYSSLEPRMLHSSGQSSGLLCMQARTAQHPGAACKATHSCHKLHALAGWAQGPGQPRWCKRLHVVCD